MKARQERKTILTVVIVMSIVLYVAGVLSGLAANKLIKEETQATLTSLENYVDILEANLHSNQLEGAFMETLSEEERCDYQVIRMKRLVTQLREYWEELPFRIEEYEQTQEITPAYKELKKAYTQASLKTWIASNNNYQVCKQGPQPLLYFYSQNCEDCVRQGEELDKLQKTIIEQGEEILVFTVDLDSEETLIQNIAEYYQVSEAPAIIYENKIHKGFHSAHELR